MTGLHDVTHVMERLCVAARARGLDVLLERPGKRVRLAVQTTRARRRETGDWHREHVGMPEVRGSLVERAAGDLLQRLEQAPPGTGESGA